MQPKTVYLDGVPIGLAAAWNEVAEILAPHLGRKPSRLWLRRRALEGPDGFYISTEPPEGSGCARGVAIGLLIWIIAGVTVISGKGCGS